MILGATQPVGKKVFIEESKIDLVNDIFPKYLHSIGLAHFARLKIF